MRDGLCLMLPGTIWPIACGILFLDPLSAWLLSVTISAEPSFHLAIFVTTCAPQSVLILGHLRGFPGCLAYSEFLVFILSCSINSTKTSIYLYTIDRHRKNKAPVFS